MLYNWARRTSNKKIETRIQFIENKLMPFCSIRFNNIFTSFLLPIVATLGLWYYLICKINLQLNNSVPYLERLSGVLFAPLIEEILTRGIMLGLIYLIVHLMVSKRLGWARRLSDWSAGLVALVVTSLVFSFLHSGKIDIRYVAGLLNGILYFLDRRNLLPAIISHVLYNLMAYFICV